LRGEHKDERRDDTEASFWARHIKPKLTISKKARPYTQTTSKYSKVPYSSPLRIRRVLVDVDAPITTKKIKGGKQNYFPRNNDYGKLTRNSDRSDNQVDQDKPASYRDKIAHPHSQKFYTVSPLRRD